MLAIFVICVLILVHVDGYRHFIHHDLKVKSKNRLYGSYEDIREKARLRREQQGGQSPPPTPVTKAQPKPIPDIDEVPVSSLKSPPKLERQNSRLTPTQITPEMMNEHRKQMRAERLKMRSDNMSSLFANSI